MKLWLWTSIQNDFRFPPEPWLVRFNEDKLDTQLGKGERGSSWRLLENIRTFKMKFSWLCLCPCLEHFYCLDSFSVESWKSKWNNLTDLIPIHPISRLDHELTRSIPQGVSSGFYPSNIYHSLGLRALPEARILIRVTRLWRKDCYQSKPGPGARIVIRVNQALDQELLSE